MKTRRIGIFYHSVNQRRPDGGLRVFVEDGAYVRVEVVHGHDLCRDALDLATPDEDENVMNTHYLDSDPA